MEEARLRTTDSAKKQKASPEARLRTPSQAYRVHFSITDKQGSWIRSPRRSIRWVFGWIRAIERPVVAVQKDGGEQVELVLSKPSGRIVYVLWNGRDITKHVRFKEHALIPNHIAGSWSTKTKQCIQILIDRSEDVASERDRYDLLLDGESFAKLPMACNLERLQGLEERRSPSSDERGSKSQHYRTGTDSPSVSFSKTKRIGSDLKYRLSLAGLKKFGSARGVEQEPKDELHSERYSPVVESLRQVITEAMPQSDQTVSRAIMAGFCSDSSSRHSMDSISMDGFCDSAVNIEANLMRDAYYWSRANIEESEDERLRFYGEQLEEIMQHVRDETLDAESASRIVLNIAAILGLRMASQLPRTTVLIDGIPIGMNEQELQAAFGDYGIVCAAAASSTLSVGFCRFEDESSAAQVVANAGLPAGGLTLEGARPSLYLVGAAAEFLSGASSQMSSVQSTCIDTDTPPDHSPSCVSKYIFK